MEPETKLTELKTILNEIADLYYASSLLIWDQQTYMPPGGAPGRGYQAATLSRLAHLKFTSPEVGALIEDLLPYANQLDPDSDDARLIQVTSRLYDKKTKVPAELVSELAQATSDAHLVWEQAREESNFGKFQPHLQRIVDLRRQYASIFPSDHIYDPLLDDYEPGLKTADVKEIFDTLRPLQVELIKEITSRPQVDDSFLHQPFDEKKQWDFGVEVITRFGYNWENGRQDKAAHPFTIRISQGDVRITTRLYPDYFSSAFFSTAHEGGHAIYEQGVAPELERTPLSTMVSLALHESQSRLYENLIGRSRDFWVTFYPRLQEYFPEQLGNVELDTFYKGINKVALSPIRVEADEATYNLHVMLRLELEIAMMEGGLDVKDVADAWNTRTQEYLGITPRNDAEGVLQDVHWSSGYIGYFSTYSMGNLIAAQLWEQVNAEIADLPDKIRQGNFSDLTEWMRNKIHRHGGKYQAQELVERVTGSKIDPYPYMRYLRRKYSDIYGL